MRAAFALALAACWTGADAPPPPAAPNRPPPPVAPIDLDISLERTACFGSCPSYTVTISGEGVVTWHGVANVRELGMRRAKLARGYIEALANAIDRARFFDLDESGNDPGTCTQNGNLTSCSFSVRTCSDTSHAIVVVRRGGRVHRIDDPRCAEGSMLARLEVLIDRVAGVERWR
jgi:hypothetical protein